MSSKLSFSNEASSAAGKRTRSRSWIMEEMEITLAEWLHKQIARDMPLSRATICEKARLIFHDLKGNDGAAPIFNASLNWLYSFKVRHGFKEAKIRREPKYVYMTDKQYREMTESKISFFQESNDYVPQVNIETAPLTWPLDFNSGSEKNIEELCNVVGEKPNEEVVDLVCEDEGEADKINHIEPEDDELIPEDYLELEMREEEQDNDSKHQVVESHKHLKVKDFAQPIESHFMDVTIEEVTGAQDSKCIPTDEPKEASTKGKTQKTLLDFFARKPLV